jgi:diguanylate cyclase (GGDEF)-like protein/PAS domain S-box-containing protein
LHTTPNVTVTASVATFSARETAQKQTYITVGQLARDRLTFVRGAAQEFLKMGSPDRLQHLISSLASDLDLVHILLVDGRDRVLASNDLSDKGSLWRSLDYALDEVVLQRVRRLEGLEVQEFRDQGHLDAYAGLCGISSADRLRPSTCGFISYRVDLRPHILATTQALRQQSAYYILGMAIVVLVTLILLHFFVGRRTQRITTALNLFAEGERASRISIDRKDEIGAIGLSVNALLSKVVEDDEAIREAHERLNALISNVVDSVIVITDSGIVEDANPATYRVFGYQPEEIIGRKINILMPEPVRGLHDSYLERYRSTGDSNVIGIGRQVEAQHKSGRRFPLDLSVSEIEVQGERLFIGILRDVSEQVAMRERMRKAYEDLKRVNSELEKQARTDKLTGLANRRQFDINCMAEALEAARELSSLSVLLLDVDYFKPFNDHYGHPAGDRCLRDIADMLRRSFSRAGDLVARYGGEEFAVILPARNQAQAAWSAARCLEAIRKRAIPHARSQIADHVTVSIGLVSYHPGSNTTIDPEELIQVADQMLYLAKAQGRNQVRQSVFSGAENDAAVNDGRLTRP